MFAQHHAQVSWVPIFKGAKLILAGDPCQLPPTVISTTQKREKKSDKAPVKKG